MQNWSIPFLLRHLNKISKDFQAQIVQDSTVQFIQDSTVQIVQDSIIQFVQESTLQVVQDFTKLFAQDTTWYKALRYYLYRTIRTVPVVQDLTVQCTNCSRLQSTVCMRLHSQYNLYKTWHYKWLDLLVKENTLQIVQDVIVKFLYDSTVHYTGNTRTEDHAFKNLRCEVAKSKLLFFNDSQILWF